MASHFLLNQTPGHQLYCGVHKEMQGKQPTEGERALKGCGHSIPLTTSGLRRPQHSTITACQKEAAVGMKVFLYSGKVMGLVKK